MPIDVSMRDMLEAGAHFGHQTRRWNPKMRPYIYGAKNGIHVINLQKTFPLFKKAVQYVQSIAAKGDQVLFVGTKHQAREVVAEEAARSDMPYITHRWLGGMLTNITTIRKSLQTIEDLDAMLAEGSVERLPKKEVLRLEKRREKLLRNLEGIRGMNGLPRALFIVDPSRERIALAEAHKLEIPTIAICDTNCDPEVVDYPIPANDDAIKSIRLFVRAAADACIDGREQHKQALIAGSEKIDGFQVGDASDDQKVEVIMRGKGPRKGRKKPEEKDVPAETEAAPESPVEAEAPVVEATPESPVDAEAPIVEEAPVEAAPVEAEAPIVEEALVEAAPVEAEAPVAKPEADNEEAK